MTGGRRAAALGPLVAASLWGGMYVVSKWGFRAVPPVTLSVVRLALGAATLLALARVAAPDRSFSRRDRRRFVVLGVLVAVTLVAQFVGTHLTNASQGALLTVLTPVFTLALGVAVLGETLTRRKVAGMALAVVGTGVVVAGQYDLAAAASVGLAGAGFLLLGSLGWAAYTVFGKPLVRRYSALEAATYSTVVAVPVTLPLVPVEYALLPGYDAPTLTPALVAAVAYLGVASTALAWYAWYKGLEYADAGTVAVFFFAQPVVGGALGAAVLGERLGAGFLVGGVVMAAGVYLVSTGRADARA